MKSAGLGAKKGWIFFVTLLVIISAVLVLYFLNPLHLLVNAECLKDTERATYEITDRKTSPAKVDIFVNSPGNESRSFQIEIPMPDHYHPIEIHRCGIYTTKSVNYDHLERKPMPGYDFSLWKYDYQGGGERLLQIAELQTNGTPLLLYGSDFRVSPDEKYLILREGYEGADKYNLVIKSLRNFKTNSLKDVLVIPHGELTQYDPNIYGSIGFNEWTKDSRYFWGNLFAGADVLAFFRVDMRTLSFDVYKAPKGVLGGNILNVENGYVTYSPNGFWTGVADVTDQVKKQQAAAGIKRELHIHHLPTGTDTTLAVVDDLSWHFHVKWLSDTELEYQLPGSITKTYIIQ